MLRRVIVEQNRKVRVAVGDWHERKDVGTLTIEMKENDRSLEFGII